MHEDYAKESCERCSVHPSDPDEMVPQNIREKVMVETAYRRGYQQGCEAMHSRWVANKDGHVCVTSLLVRVYSWRFCKHNGRFTKPPW